MRGQPGRKVDKTARTKLAGESVRGPVRGAIWDCGGEGGVVQVGVLEWEGSWAWDRDGAKGREIFRDGQMGPGWS